MADLPPGVIPVSSEEFDRLYPIYELEARPGQTFQEWLKARRLKAVQKKRARIINPIQTESAK